MSLDTEAKYECRFDLADRRKACFAFVWSFSSSLACSAIRFLRLLGSFVFARAF
jgi:hypothetical protein